MGKEKAESRKISQSDSIRSNKTKEIKEYAIFNK
jgi:hypothetical protein